jgi:hypothetical protein
MKCLCIHRRLFRFALLGSAVLCCWLTDASEVQGSCGDYVMIGGHARGHQGSPTMSPDGGSSSENNKPTPLPCPGGVCSQRDHLPPSPSVPKINLEQEQWATLAGHLQLTTLEFSSTNGESFLIRPENHELSILRPPR